jgi:tetratricopeptide (TPR) repeat protein
MADIDKAIELSPTDPKTLRVRATLKLNLKDMAGALDDFDKAIQLDPEDLDTIEAKGLLLATDQKWPEARATFDLGIKAAKGGPRAPGMLLQRARVNMAAGDTNSGLADFSEVLRLDPGNLAALVMRAEAAAEDHPDQAIEDLNRALELRPGLVPALRQRGVILANAKKYAAAISDFELIRKLEPKDHNVALQLGQIYTLDGKQAEAAKVYNSILQDDPKNWLALRGRGDAMLNQGKQREAIADYESALAEKPSDSGILNNLAWVLATSPDDEIRNGKRSIELATQAAEETEFKQAHILSTLAASYAETGDFAKAIEWSKKAIEISAQALKPALAKELESYEAKKPWRELQTVATESAKPKETTPR